MSDPNKHKLRDGFRVVGPNTSDYEKSIWYFKTLEEAKTFAFGIAADVDAEYEIYQYVGSIGQIPTPTRPIQFIGAPQ